MEHVCFEVFTQNRCGYNNNLVPFISLFSSSRVQVFRTLISTTPVQPSNLSSNLLSRAYQGMQEDPQAITRRNWLSHEYETKSPLKRAEIF